MSTLIKGKELTLRIGALAKQGKAMVKEIEFLAKCACVEAVATRNCNSINRLRDATRDIGGGALMLWIKKHGPVTYDKASDKFVLNDKKHEAAKEKGEAYQTELEAAKSYAEAAPASMKNPLKFDLDDAVRALIKRAERAMAEAEQDAEAQVDVKSLPKLIEFAATLPIKVKATAGKPAPKSKSSKGRTLTAETETVATA